MRLLAVAGLVVGVGVLAACDAPAPEPSPPEPSTTAPPPPPPPSFFEVACDGGLQATTPGTVASPAVTELSGLSSSRRNPGVWWVHNDSGDSARVFAVGENGRDLGQWSLTGASAVDWEDMAVGPGPVAGTSYLYVGDIGGNISPRSSVIVYRVAEPAVSTAPASPPSSSLTEVAALTLTYPSGTYDAEGLLVDPVSGELFVVTKDLVGGTARVFRAPANLAAGSTTALTQVTTVSLGLGGGVTAADVSPDGKVVALRTYGSVRLFPRPGGAPLADAFAQTSCNGATAREAQGEAIGFTADSRGYMTASEGVSPALHRFVQP